MDAFELEDGSRASILESDGERVVLSAERAAPPGATLKLRRSTESESYDVKVRSCRRVAAAAPAFRIEGRWVNLTRGQRERVSAPRS
jgi:hypothetical protein